MRLCCHNIHTGGRNTKFFLQALCGQLIEAGKIYSGWDIFFIAQSRSGGNKDNDGIYYIPDEQWYEYRCLQLADGDPEAAERIYNTYTPVRFAKLIAYKLAVQETKLNALERK